MFTLTAALIVENKDLRDELSAAIAQLPVRILFDEPSVGDWADFDERLVRTAVDVIIIDVAAAGVIEAAVARIRSSPARPAVVVAHSCADPDLILRSLRAGASEYLYAPVADSLSNALTRIAAERQQAKGEGARTGGRIIGFLSAKGGCGATTVACHVALDLPSKTKQKVLLADCDFESGLVSFVMKSHSGYSVSDVAGNIHRLDESYWRAVVSNGKPGLEVLSAPHTPAARNIQLQNLPTILNFAGSRYAWVVVDLGRSVTSTTLTIAETIQDLYLVTTADLPALHQAKQALTLFSEAGYPAERVRVVLNRMPRRMDVTVDELENMLGAPICITIPDDPGRLEEALANGSLLEPTDPLGRHFARLAAKVCGMPAEPPVRKFLGFF